MRFLTTPPFGRSSGEQARAPFLLLVALTACGTMGMHVIIPALPATARALHMSISTTQLTITLYLVGLAFGQLFYGPVWAAPLCETLPRRTRQPANWRC